MFGAGTSLPRAGGFAYAFRQSAAGGIGSRALSNVAAMEGSEAAGAPRIMVVAALGRRDIVSMFDLLVGQAELTFVEYARNWGHGLDPAAYEGIGRLTTWEEHSSADALLDSVRPTRVAMLSIGSRNQLALRAAARRRGIPVDHVEHGYRLPATVRQDPALGGAARSGPRSTVRGNRFFVDSTIREGFPGAVRLAEAGFRATLDGGAIAHPRLARARRPDRYVSFSEECFAYHRVADRVPVELADRTVFVGVPQFDVFAIDRLGSMDCRTAIMADHQLHNAGLRGWDARYRHEWARRLEHTLRDASWKLVVKRHPGDRENIWRDADPMVVSQVDSIEELASRATTASLVLGTGSTLQLPLMALPRAAAVALEIHPKPGPDLSGPIVDAGVAEPVTSFGGLGQALRRVPALRQAQVERKPAFVKRFLFQLDGNARHRLAAALLESR